MEKQRKRPDATRIATGLFYCLIKKIFRQKKNPDLLIEIGDSHKMQFALEDIKKIKDEKEGYLH
ncbi:hypothetical protein LBMAG21_03200 [Armatimonadota bacterium]|nr:hypothetical protein LBMAG21_03200 [Armatimonadota bacterium]